MSNAREPAFPSHGSMGEVAMTGVSKREYLAGLAMQGMLSNFQFVSLACKEAEDRGIGNCIVMAELAIRQADALLAALEKAP